jgi:NADPH-dependent F420 reductase
LPTDIFASSITTVVFTVKKLTKMKKIAIIGAAGNMGSNIARNLSKAGYSINLSDNDADKLATFQAELAQLGNGTIIISPTPVAAVQQSDVVILAVWHGVQETIADQIRSAVQGKIVVSIANPLNDTYDGLTTASNTSSAEELAALLPNAKVVKSFNTVFAGDFQNTTLDGKQVDCFVAGDDESAVKSVEQLVADAGFNPLVAGKLSASRTLENMTVMLIGLSQRYGYNWVAGWKVLSNNVVKMAAVFLMAMSILVVSCKKNESLPTQYSDADIEQMRTQLALLTKDADIVKKNLATFDTLDYTVFSNQEWTRLHESHSDNVRVFWPDGHLTTGIGVHIEDLKKLFVYAPDTRIKEHPIRFGSGKFTAVTGVFEGTFTRPMPIGNGQFIQPTGKAFKMPMATIGIWENGEMVEEHLFWDNATYAKQIGL